MTRTSAKAIRDQVIDAALARMDEAGPDAVSLRQVAADVGRSTQVIYSYFKDRDDLMAALRVRIQLTIAERCRAYADAVKAADLESTLEAAGRAIIDYALDHPQLYAFANTGATLGGPVDAPANADVAEAWAFLVDPLRAARDGASTAALQAELDLRYAMTHGIATLAINGHYAPDSRRRAHELLSLAMQLAPRTGWPLSTASKPSRTRRRA